jgi:cation diffusion facilitator family transporter
MIAIQIAYESVLRLINPVSIAYGEAIAVACLGLMVNLLSAYLLRGSHDHHHGHGHAHEHDHDHDDHDHHDHDQDDHDHHHHHVQDNNFRAAYIHVLADAATSILAIGALVVAMYSGWAWADPAVGIVGSIVIASWAYTLIRDAGGVLLDVHYDRKLERKVRARLEAGQDRVTDLHLWQVGPGHCAAVISLISDKPLAPAVYKERLRDLKGLSHITIEIAHCPHH